MQVVFAGQEMPTRVNSSIFLAGPTPRDEKTPSWRPEALGLLVAAGYEGHVFVPETPRHEFSPWGPEDAPAEPSLLENGSPWLKQVEWEQEALKRADQIVFWIPRAKPHMLGLTTNNEFGYWIARDPSKMVLGVPPGATQTSYQLHQAAGANVPTFLDLSDALACAVKRLGQGQARAGGECCVPLHVWTTRAFALWHHAQVETGNELLGGEVLWVFRIQPENRVLFCFAFLAKMWVREEGRVKDIEFVFGRPDVSTVVGLHQGANDRLHDIKVVMVREFRTPARTSDGFVLEPAGGSTFKAAMTASFLAAAEFMEETGISVEPHRLAALGGRQVCSTLSSHRSHLFWFRLTDEELEVARRREDERRVGGDSDEERTRVRVMTIPDILNAGRDVDWAAIGQILAAADEAQVRMPD